MGQYKASIYNYLFNSINAIVMIINGIIMVPIYLKFMPMSTYGAWLATGNVVAMMGIVESGFASVITQKMSVAIANNDNKLFFRLAGANIYTALMMASFLFLLGMSITPFVADWINADEQIKQSITAAYIISLASAAISLIVSLLGAFPQVWQETKTIGIIVTIVNIVAIIALIIYLYLGFGVVSLALGYITRALLNLLSQGIWILVKWRNLNLSMPGFNIDDIKELLKACLYPFFSRISNVLVGNSQSFIIAIFINPSLAAIFDITSKIAIVSCNFVNMANGSFFALFSLTFASKNKITINNLVQRISKFFMTVLISALLFTMIFTRPIVHFWVGLDKFGGNFLLGLIVIATLITQLKLYYTNLLYTGGLINKSAKLDVISMLVYMCILLSTIKPFQLFALPIATSVTGIIFVGLYLKLLKENLQVEIKTLIKVTVKSLLITIPFILLHFSFNVNLLDPSRFIIYGILFSILYLIVIGVSNLSTVKLLYLKLSHVKY